MHDVDVNIASNDTAQRGTSVVMSVDTTHRQPYGEMVLAGNGAAGGAPNTTNYRDVTDKFGFTYRQFPSGDIVVLVAPQVDNFGYWTPGTRGGRLEGVRLTPSHVLWHKVTRQIGPAPGSVSGGSGSNGGYAGYGQRQATTYTVKPGDTLSKITQRLTGNMNRWPELHAVNSWVRDPNVIKPGAVLQLPANWQADGPRRGGGGFVQTITDILRGFGPEPTQAPVSQVTAAGVQALPGIQATIGQMVHPGTLRSLHKELGKLQGRLATESNPRKRAQLEAQISGVQYQIANLKGQLETVPGALPTAAGAPMWPVWVGLGVVALGVAGLAATGGGRRRRR